MNHRKGQLTPFAVIFRFLLDIAWTPFFFCERGRGFSTKMA